ncbi:MAG: hypothetical protein NXI00_16050 [Cytophagales bacterium]|nr:hypothetical protein [Cytophagales bacterium]
MKSEEILTQIVKLQAYFDAFTSTILDEDQVRKIKTQAEENFQKTLRELSQENTLVRH